KAKLFVPFGASFQLSGTDVSEPSHVNSFGIAPLCLNAELINSNAIDGMSFQFRSFNRLLRACCRRRGSFSSPCGGISLAFGTCRSYRRFRRFAGSPLTFRQGECFEIRKTLLPVDDPQWAACLVIAFS